MYISFILHSLLLVVGLFIANKYKNKEVLALALLGGAGVVLDIIDYLVKVRWDLSNTVQLLSSGASLLLALITLLIFVFVVRKWIKNK